MPPKTASGKLTSTSSKTPVKSARNRGYVTKTPISSKPKPKPNASILNYFTKKADETLFIGEGGVGLDGLEDDEEVVEGNGDANKVPERETVGEEEKATTKDAVVEEVKEVKEEKRFNEAGGPIKKRRVSSSSDAEEEPRPRGKKVKATADEVGVKKEVGKERRVGQKSEEEKTEEKHAVPQSSGAQSTNAVGKPRRGPFLDDSDEEDEDEVEAGKKSTSPTAKPVGLAGDEKRKKEEESADKTKPKPTMEDVTEKPRVPLLRQETSGARADNQTKQEEEPTKDDADHVDQDTQKDKKNHDNDLQGEELREKRYVQEQARLEQGFIGDDDFDEMLLDDAGFIDEIEDDDDLTFPTAGPDAITESCPICNASLAGVTSDQATAHVNACLDGNPTPLPAPTVPTITAKQQIPKAKDESQESGYMVNDTTMADLTEGSRRFASRAAIARPGQANPISLPGDDDDPSYGPDAKPKTNGGGSSAFSKLMSSHTEAAAWATAAAVETASRGMPAYKRTCPFYKIMPNFSICVDAFRYGAVQGCKAYFLSHFHSDHYMGLSASWVHGPIYCSKVTGSLVKTQLRTAAKYVVELEFGETVPVPQTGGAVMVTMIEANHCPGSSLFLFEKQVGKEGRTQRILHCGDFRACPAHVEHPLLKPETLDKVTGKTRQQKIDVCYLDTTYLNPRYSFPPQEDVIHACAEVCAKLDKGLKDGNEAEWERLLRVREGGGNLKEGKDVSQFFGYNSKRRKGDGGGIDASNPTPPEDKEHEEDTKTKPPSNAFTALTSSSSSFRKNRLLVVCGTYSIGKERICVAIAQALGSKIFASPSKIRITKQLGDAELFGLMTSDPREAQVHMQALGEIRADTLAEYLELHRSNGFSRIVGFRPSGWSYRPGSGSNNNNNNNNNSSSSYLPFPPDLDVGGGASVPVTATLPPSSLPTTHLLHGNRFRPRFFAKNVIPQRGSGKEAMCFGVPYSEHSSFRELALFLMALRVEKVVPTVNVGSEASRTRMKGWIDRWVGERRRGGLVRVLHEDGEKVKGQRFWDWEGWRGGGVYW
ncbi:unnamed protein product [Sordaria macrospora k-hell]|uniref:WGS project CABT00000000 data, contig 2.1 n=1 Tax=Sordaria macrospora (strain ATCC MYA-333 / DSM 997 / K(L3346) / K-hell) TaxID=771870 RepID=F7VKT5_SORMK|nr:uncharacterized protein SMAC_00330 [Sordaria macrospora k-hell]CCC06112.1 unnamed protein product [Sordaria macrospora k-hell]